MRALIPGVFVALISFSTASFAFSTEQVAPRSSTGAQIADPEEQLENQVKTGTTSGNGFFITGGVDGRSDSPFNAFQPAAPVVPYGYTPVPTIRTR